MDLETIKRINRDALRAAQESEMETMADYQSDDKNNLVMWIVAIAVGIASYFLLKHFKPNFVTTTVNGLKKFDNTRAIIASVVAGLIVLLIYYLVQKN